MSAIKTAGANLAVLLLCLSCATLNAAEIRFRPRAKCAGDVWRLGDVADVISVDRREREALAAIELGPAGPARQTLRAREVQDRLAAHGLNLVNHEFSGSAAILLEPKDSSLSADGQRPISKSALNLARAEVVDAIVAHLKRTVDADEEWTVDVELTAEQLRAMGGQRGRATASGGRAPWTGAQTFTLTTQAANGEFALAVAADVRRAPRVVVAVNPILRGERIRAGDVELERVKAGSPQRMTFSTLDDVVGKEAARNIPAGQPLDNQYVRSPLLVRRGDVVDLFARAGGVQVSTKARAREEGSHGDLINVELLADRRPLLARICGVQEVEILAAAPSVWE
jgi:flagella basal body P-ring formation protein FlgA